MIRGESSCTAASSSLPATRTPAWPWRSATNGRPTADQGVHHAGPGDGNPEALKNLGAILGKEGDSLRALYYLRQSLEIGPQDPQTVYGLAFAYMELGDMEPAQNHFQAVLEMEAPEELRGLARDGLRKIAARELRPRGPRMDAVFYLLDALRLFRGMSLQEIQEITFETAEARQKARDMMAETVWIAS